MDLRKQHMGRSQDITIETEDITAGTSSTSHTGTTHLDRGCMLKTVHLLSSALALIVLLQPTVGPTHPGWASHTLISTENCDALKKAGDRHTSRLTRLQFLPSRPMRPMQQRQTTPEHRVCVTQPCYQFNS